MLELAHPWALALLPAPLLVRWLTPSRRERTGALRAPFFDDLVRATGVEARSGAVVLRKTWFQRILLICCWLLVVGALGKPQWVGDPIVRTESSRDVMLAIDLSGSMNYVDFPGADGTLASRFTAVQRVVDAFVASRDGDRVGLIVFGSRAYLQLPFTRDLDSARALVALMDVGMAGPQTALGDAIGLSIRAFEESEVDQRLLILLTDGNDTASKMSPINAAEIARLNGVEVYTIGVGDPEATGEDRVDFAALEAVADRTGGAFFTADDEAALTSVYERIDALSPGEVRTQSWRPRDSLVHWPAGAAALLALFGYAMLLLGSRRREVSP
ncbi:MAG: VWA domain-containing protein [Pseudomonadota bacterium]